MKKFTVLCLAGLLVLAFAAAASAQEVKLDFRASGSIDAQTHWSRNVPPLNPAGPAIYGASGGTSYSSFTAGRADQALNHNVSYWDSRMSLRFEANMGKELSGVLQFEVDAGRWGSSPTGVSGNIRDAGNVGQWSTDRTAIEIKYMYFDVGLPYIGIPIPMNVRLGAQPMAIRPWFFAATDGTGVSGGLKIDPVNINPFYFKPKEGTDWAADDVDIYGLQVNAKISTFTVGGYGVYYNMNNYPMFVASSIGAALPVLSSIAPQIGGTSEASLWWFGFYADGKAGPVDVNFDFGYDFGKVKAKGDSSPSNYVKYSGWATRLKVDYPWERFNFGVIGMYGSGSDANKTSGTGLPGSVAANGGQSTRVNGWMVPVGSEAGAANAESAVFYGMEAGASGGQGFAVNHNYNQASKGPFGGSWFAKLYGSYKITPWYKVTLQGLYIGDTTKHGNTYGTARSIGGQSTLLRDDDFIGVELDLLNEIQIYKNLTFKVFGGYLWAGNALDLFAGNPTGNFEMKNPWAIRTRLLYTF